MSEETYRAMRAYIDLAVELKVEKRLTELRSAAELKTPEPIAGPPGKDGKDGKDGLPGEPGQPSTIPGPKGEPGERGANGIATREELESIVEARFADINVRTFADVYQGVYKPGELYKRGLLTTWGGSLWLSLSDTKAKPGETPDWKLVVKK